jgi:hypothetical protein
MVMFNDVAKMEEKYKKMKNGTSILFNRINESDAIKTMQGCFKSFLEKKGINSPTASAISEIFAFDLVLFEEAMEEERKERFFEFVSSTFSKEFLRGEDEKLLFDKTLKRMGKKLKEEEKRSLTIK